ncbi:hypothetical protein ACH4JZ_14775 [Streptomyces sp. NPDC017615]|uniref:hypothetical protein n=1 Tax=Streptomyces sp. NPDC017615 TaxID=3365003 RepID=UPI00378F1301
MPERASSLLDWAPAHEVRLDIKSQAAYADILATTALSAPGRTSVLTSDPEGLTTLCGTRVTVTKT